MKGVYAYLSNDGTCHWWDVANRGGAPLCGAQDVSFLTDQRKADVIDPPACDNCIELMRTILEWEDYQERG